MRLPFRVIELTRVKNSVAIPLFPQPNVSNNDNKNVLSAILVEEPEAERDNMHRRYARL